MHLCHSLCTPCSSGESGNLSWIPTNGDWNGVEIPNGGYRAIEATRRKGASTSLVRQRWKRAGVLKRVLEQDGTRMGPARSVLLKKRAGVLISAVLPRAEMEGGWVSD